MIAALPFNTECGSTIAGGTGIVTTTGQIRATSATYATSVCNSPASNLADGNRISCIRDKDFFGRADP
jgi:hypothetical protein